MKLVSEGFQQWETPGLAGHEWARGCLGRLVPGRAGSVTPTKELRAWAWIPPLVSNSLRRSLWAGQVPTGFSQ